MQNAAPTIPDESVGRGGRMARWRAYLALFDFLHFGVYHVVIGGVRR
jgi:hypothetical protein